MKSSFLIYLDYKEQFELLTDEELGQLLRAIMLYEETGKITELSGMLKMAFSFIRTQLDRDRDKWEGTKNKRSEAGKKGMANRWNNKNNEVITEDNKNNNVINDITRITKITDNVNEEVNDNVKVDVNEDEKVEVKDKYNNIIGIYNSYCPNLPRVQKLTSKRKIAINKLLKEITPQQFIEVCILANNTDFLIGDNDRNWKADFDFMIRPDKAVSILEGKYNNKKKDKMDGFIDLWKEAKDEEERNGANNNTFGW